MHLVREPPVSRKCVAAPSSSNMGSPAIFGAARCMIDGRFGARKLGGRVFSVERTSSAYVDGAAHVGVTVALGPFTVPPTRTPATAVPVAARIVPYHSRTSATGSHPEGDAGAAAPTSRTKKNQKAALNRTDVPPSA
jgi:hypothetical protein